MKASRGIFFLMAMLIAMISDAQQTAVVNEQQIENETSVTGTETEDDSYITELEQFKKDPVNLNEADAEQLQQLRLLSTLQIAQLISYRQVFGKFIDLYELQAVPLFDVTTIRKILPYVSVADRTNVNDSWKKRLTKGEHSILVRVSQVLEASRGYTDTAMGNNYLGSQQKIFFRYRYRYKNLLQAGITGDKDAGEPLFTSAQKTGFDFYSFHFFARKMGFIRALALGDFVVNMGQGLIQWQGMAFKKSSDVLSIKRQAPVLMPYSSAGEFYFHRGVGVTIGINNFSLTLFGSFRKLDANINVDTISGQKSFSGFISSGYHRNAAENYDRHSVDQRSFGANLVFKKHNWHVAINGVSYQFSLPVKKEDDPYNLFALHGERWWNTSIDYSYTQRNFHYFGEIAFDRNLRRALIQGLLISVDRRVDLSFVHRDIGKDYQAVYGNAFTENTNPGNENGFYAGMLIRPSSQSRIDIYADVYRFPWLRYLVDGPGYGKDYLFQYTFMPNKKTELYSRIRIEEKTANEPGTDEVTHHVVSRLKINWRTHINYMLSDAFSLRCRVEAVWFRPHDKPERGFLYYTDLLYKPLLKPYTAVVRFQYVEAGGYDTRIYAYENDVLYNFSIPAFYDKGFRWYADFSIDIKKNITCWLRIAQTLSPGKDKIGDGLDEISGKHRTEVKAQIRYNF